MKNTFFKASGRNLLTCAICALMAMRHLPNKHFPSRIMNIQPENGNEL
mgnify:CR=1 FL=1